MLLFAAALGVVSIAGYAYWMTDSAKPLRIERMGPQTPGPAVDRRQGDPAPSEPVEPILVCGPLGRLVVVAPRPDEPAPRVVMTPDMPQPPRPDAEPGTAAPRMPYADEDL
jgi:hypothetical protein